METGLLTKESDVYSFGVVLFEVLCGRLCIANYDDDRRFLSNLARKCYKEKKMGTILLDYLQEQISAGCLHKFSEIAYQCLRRDRMERPLAAEIVKQLEIALRYQVEYDVTKKTGIKPLPTVDQSEVKSDMRGVKVGDMSAEELKAYDGKDPEKPFLMAIKGQIYDASESRAFYGPGGPYGLFAGKDASRALVKMSFDDEDMIADVTGLGEFEREALEDWEYKFMSKYVKVGNIINSK